jgi:hypothetical protein
MGVKKLVPPFSFAGFDGSGDEFGATLQFGHWCHPLVG